MAPFLFHLLVIAALSTSAFATAVHDSSLDHRSHSSEGSAAIVERNLATQGLANTTTRFAKVTRRSVKLSERATTKAAGQTFYSALVAIGASYTDNAHARSSQYSSSLRNYYPYNKWGGRYSNGPVAVEYMVDASVSPALKKSPTTAVKLKDYAYGGSVVQNGLTGTSANSPAAKDQIAAYLADLKSGAAAVGNGRVLHYFNSGINSVAQIWTNAVNAGLSSSAIANAQSYITQNTVAYATAIRTINTNNVVYTTVHGADFLLVGIPPLEIVPTFANQLPKSYSTSQRTKALSLLKTLSAQYNSELKAFATSLKSEARNGRVFYYDLATLWYSLNSSPKSYGLTASPITTTCYNSTTGGICTNPSAYLYFDTLHPVTSIHKLMAEKMNALVLGK
ncbi:hypothetical protein JCM21900_000091 [Sporobolomyces salmonicolor]